MDDLSSAQFNGYATSCPRLMGKIGKKERSLLWEIHCGGLSVWTSLGGLGANGGAKGGPRHYEIFRSTSDLRSLEGHREGKAPYHRTLALQTLKP